MTQQDKAFTCQGQASGSPDPMWWKEPNDFLWPSQVHHGTWTLICVYTHNINPKNIIKGNKMFSHFYFVVKILV